MGILSDEEWREQVAEMFDQAEMPDDLEPMDLLGVIEPPVES